MKKTFTTTSIILIIWSLVSCEKALPPAEPEKPANIILIYTDDQGIGDIGFNGNPYIKTPHIDRLANEGIIFENFYVAPVCTPSRASLMTGKFSIRTGVFDTFNGGAIMATEEVTMAEIFREHHYKTGIFGKWHLGDHYPFRPSDQGFDESLVHKGGGIGQPGDADNYYAFDSSYFAPSLYKNNVLVGGSKYCSDEFTDGLLAFIRQNHEVPFFAYLAFNAPHTPLQLPQEYYDMYEGLQEEMQKDEDPRFMTASMTDRDFEVARRVYGMVSNIDDNIGRVVEELEKQDILDETIILFISDNGPSGKRYRMGLRGQKSNVYEGGIKVPAIMYHAGLKPKRVATTLSHIDLLPTLLDYTGLERTHLPQDIDGISFAPLLEGAADPEEFYSRTLYYHWHRGYPEPYRNIAVRQGDYKLVGNGGTDMATEAFELFNLKDDPFEEKNLAAQNPEKVQELKTRFDTWLSEQISEMGTPHQAFIIGTEHQTSTMLNRNDANGMPTMWGNDQVFGYWDVAVANQGTYKMIVKFRKPLEEVGTLVTRLGPSQRTVEISEAGIQEIVIDSFPLNEGTFRLESGFRAKSGQHLFPFTITIERTMNSGN